MWLCRARAEGDSVSGSMPTCDAIRVVNLGISLEIVMRCEVLLAMVIVIVDQGMTVSMLMFCHCVFVYKLI